MKEGLLSNIYFFLLLIYIFLIPQIEIIGEESEVNLGYLFYYTLLSFSLFQIFILLYTGEIFNRLVKEKFILWISLFLLFAAISNSWSSGFTQKVQILKIVKLILLIAPILFQDFRENRIDLLYRFYYFGTILGSFQVIYNYYFVADYYYGIKRSFIMGVDPNESAMIIVFGIGLALFFYFKSKNFLYLISCIPQVIAVFYTGSRTGFAAIIICIIISMYLYNVIKFSFSSLIIIITLASSILLLPKIVPSENLNRIISITDSVSTLDMSGRERIWAEAFRLIPERLLYGYGMNSFADVMEKHFARWNAHNVFIKVQFELGIIGIVSLLLSIFYCFMKILKSISVYKSFLLVFFAMIMISFLQLSWIFNLKVFVLISLLYRSAVNKYPETIKNET